MSSRSPVTGFRAQASMATKAQRLTALAASVLVVIGAPSARLVHEDESGKKLREPGHVGDERASHASNQKERERRAVHLEKRLPKSIGSEKQVHTHGRSQVAELQVGEEDDAEVKRVDSIKDPKRSDKRNHDHDRGIDVHETAHDQQKQVEEQEKDQGRAHERLNPLDPELGNVREHEVVREPEGDAQDDEYAADDRGGIAAHPQQILSQVQLAVDDELEHERIEHRQRRGLDEGGEATEDASQHH